MIANLLVQMHFFLSFYKKVMYMISIHGGTNLPYFSNRSGGNSIIFQANLHILFQLYKANPNHHRDNKGTCACARRALFTYMFFITLTHCCLETLKWVHRQTVQTQIRRCIKRHLIRISTVCQQQFLSREITPNTT